MNIFSFYIMISEHLISFLSNTAKYTKDDQQYNRHINPDLDVDQQAHHLDENELLLFRPTRKKS